MPHATEMRDAKQQSVTLGDDRSGFMDGPLHEIDA
jgi:hypothetical protein